MPASDLDWTSLPNGPIFSVFSTNKRKATQDDSLETPSMIMKPEPMAKRRCDWQLQQQISQQHHVSQHIQPAQQAFTQELLLHNNNNNTMLSSPCESAISQMNQATTMQDETVLQQQQVSNPALVHVMSQQPPRVPSPWPSQHPFHIQQSEEHIMDLNEGTYTSATDMEAACSSMEADYTPDPNQYKNHTSPDTDFCKSYCGIGETSPHSGRVRCFCKPSWEGMLDMKPYISDVY